MVEPIDQDGVTVLTFSPIVRDRRVLRQCALLRDMGFEPLAVAYAAPGERIPFNLKTWPIPRISTALRLWTTARQMPSHLGLAAAKLGFWAEPRHRWALSELRRARPAFVIANDWPALVVAARYKAESQCKLHYDSHEFATLEFDESAWWRLVYKPMVLHLERSAIYSADTVSTVGPRLADAMQQLYDLKETPAVVRNIPDRIALPADPKTHWPLRILYHGQVLPDRGLEALIDSLSDWHAAHTLTIRGNGAEAYMLQLKARVEATGRGNLVTFEKAVSPDQVMPLAAIGADLGVHFTPLGTDQRHFSLPNKLFEYIGSGLAVAVSPGADLKQVVLGHGVGVVSADAGPQAIAATINGLTQSQVHAFKAQARRAAEILCWEFEREVLAERIGPVLPTQPEFRT